MKESKHRSLGFWVLLSFGLIILIMLLTGQMMSFINYEFTVAFGLQESVDVIGDMGVAFNKAFGVGDTLVYMPMLFFGLIGIWCQKKWGVYTMIGALAITAYWPMVNIFFLYFASGLPGFYFTDFLSYTIVLSLITIYGLWGLWYLYHYYDWV